MQHKLPPLPVRILLLLVIVSVGYYAFRSLQPQDTGALTASGTIEATVVNVSPELAGKVKDVLVEEGQPAKLGDPLLMLDDSLLASQRGVAVAQLDSANGRSPVCPKCACYSTNPISDYAGSLPRPGREHASAGLVL